MEEYVCGSERVDLNERERELGLGKKQGKEKWGFRDCDRARAQLGLEMSPSP